MKKVIALLSSIAIHLNCMAEIQILTHADVEYGFANYVIGNDNIIYADGDNQIITEEDAPVGSIMMSELLTKAVSENPDMYFAIQFDVWNFNHEVYEQEFQNNHWIGDITYAEFMAKIAPKGDKDLTEEEIQAIRKIVNETAAYVRECIDEAGQREPERLKECGIQIIDDPFIAIVTAEELNNLPMSDMIGYKVSLAMPLENDIITDTSTDTLDIETTSAIVETTTKMETTFIIVETTRNSETTSTFVETTVKPEITSTAIDMTITPETILTVIETTTKEESTSTTTETTIEPKATSTTVATTTIEVLPTETAVSHIASDKELCNWAIKDYQTKKGILPATAEIRKEENGQYQITLMDQSENVLDVYEIEPATGIGIDTNEEKVNLPQTGNNSIKNLFLMLAALLMTGLGLWAIKLSGVIRTKK